MWTEMTVMKYEREEFIEWGYFYFVHCSTASYVPHRTGM